MARCGCGGACACNLTAGTNTTVSGTGSAADPWVISSVTDCGQVRTCITGADGVAFDQGTGVISACLSTDEGNNLSYGSDGCLYCGTNCAEVRTCISAAPGLTYNPGTGVMGPDISDTPGNNLVVDANGLYVPAGAATVSTGCGITGDGSAGAPVKANVGTWPWPCPISNAFDNLIYCDPASGQLIGDPSYEFRFRSVNQDFTYPDIAVPAAADTVIQSISASTTNPSTCRTAQVAVIQETDFYINLPAGAEAAWGQGTDEFGHIKNTGTSGFNEYHFQSMKMFSGTSALGSGATFTHNWDATMGRGAGGATYHRLSVNTRFLIMTN